MVQPPSSPNNFSADFDHHLVLCPTGSAAHVLTEPAARSAGRLPAVPQARVTRRAQGRVVVLEVAGRLGEAVQDVDKAIQLALAERPRGVVCDLSAVPVGAEPGAVQVLATAGRYVRHWPAIPIAVACPDPRVRDGLSNHPLGRHLIVAESIVPAVSAVLATPISDVDLLRLTPHPTAPRASRDFIAHVLLGWGLGPLIPAASLVVSELVTNSTIHAGTDIELSVAWNLGLLRLTVADNSPDLPRRLYPQLDDVHGRGLNVAAALSRAVGVLPTAGGGKVVWAVLNAARPNPPTSNEIRNPKPVLKEQLGPAYPQTRRELSTYSHPLPTTRDGSSQNETVATDQR
jgi:hypothetical protein